MDELTIAETEFIERTLASEKYHVIDYIPFHPENQEFLKLEEFWEKNERATFSKGIAFVLLNFLYQHYRCIGMRQISDYQWVISANATTEVELAKLYDTLVDTAMDTGHYQVVYFICEEDGVLVEVQPDFSVTLFGLSSQNLSFLLPLVQSRGLFLKSYDGGFRSVL